MTAPSTASTAPVPSAPPLSLASSTRSAPPLISGAKSPPSRVRATNYSEKSSMRSSRRLSRRRVSLPPSDPKSSHLWRPKHDSRLVHIAARLHSWS
uniref:Uncharacterized protein n=1 Tax=Steinernema glaseri TaxID=37863 RepID=A0A1I7Z8A4_9BILA